jgi:hypothetical protein
MGQKPDRTATVRSGMRRPGSEEPGNLALIWLLWAGTTEQTPTAQIRRGEFLSGKVETEHRPVYLSVFWSE